jgi:hypothetical protein
MSISTQGILDRAFLLANSIGTDAHQSPVVDNKYALEVLFPHSLREAVRIGAGIENEANSLKRAHSLTVTNGEAALPVSVLEECLDSSTVYGDDIGDLTSYEPRYEDFIRVSDDNLNLYTCRGGTFCFREAGGEVGEFDGDVNLVAVSMPDIPTTITDAMTINNSTAERVIEILARKLRGVE